MTRLSQADRIAAVLADGRPHTAAEIHMRCGFSRLNSRIAEMRSRRGMTIECRHIPGVGRGPDAYEYRLLTPLKHPSVPPCPADGCLSGAVNQHPTASAFEGDTADGAAQLTVWDLLGAAA